MKTTINYTSEKEVKNIIKKELESPIKDLYLHLEKLRNRLLDIEQLIKLNIFNKTLEKEK